MKDDEQKDEVAETEYTLLALQRFMQLFPHDADIDLIILKGHLLIEEQLIQIIEERLPDSEALRWEMEFFQRMCLAKALCFPNEAHPDIWAALERLNRLRNKIAHNIDVPGRTRLIENVMEAFPTSFDKHTGTLNYRFQMTLWSLFVAAADLVRRPSAQVLQLVPKEQPLFPPKGDGSLS